jgi:integrase/recombinase XerC
MLEIKIELFLDYYKVSNFATRSIQSLRVRLNEFNRFINEVPVESIQAISYRDLKEFVTCIRDARSAWIRSVLPSRLLWGKNRSGLKLPSPDMNRSVLTAAENLNMFVLFCPLWSALRDRDRSGVHLVFEPAGENRTVLVRLFVGNCCFCRHLEAKI